MLFGHALRVSEEEVFAHQNQRPLFGPSLPVTQCLASSSHLQRTVPPVRPPPPVLEAAERGRLGAVSPPPSPPSEN
jgi:hypothetical protein